jgi:hypothetical protein
VSQKVSLLNAMHNGSSSMNSQRTLEIIRDELKSDSLKECEGTYWDSRHPHLFVVMGASVSIQLLSIFNNPF